MNLRDTSVTIDDTTIYVTYSVAGEFSRANSTDPGTRPTAEVEKLYIGGADVTRLLCDSKIFERITECVQAQVDSETYGGER